MKQTSPVRLIAAAAITLAIAFPASLSAQNSPTETTALTTLATVSSVATSALVLSADLSLPDAPEPQSTSSSSQSVPDPAPTAPATSSPAAPSDSRPDSPAKNPQNPSPAAAPAPAGTPSPSSATPPAPTKQQQHEEAERELQVQEKQRLLGIMPQFQVVMGGTAVPLTPGQKWRLALHSAIDPFYIGWAFVIGGGYGELADSESQQGYHWGAPGYFKRVGSNYADNVNGALIGNALLPALLHQDPRYFRKGTGSVKSRFVYAALSTVICHGDNGKNQFNTSNVLGNFISGAISNAYYPADQRGVGLTLTNGIDVTLFGALGGQLLEFGPDLTRHLHRRPKPETSIPIPAAVP